MCIKLIGRKKNLEVYRDPNYIFPDPTPVIIDKEKQRITFGLISTRCSCSLDSVRVLQVKIDTWIVIFEDAVLGVNTSLMKHWEVEYKDFHITKSGIYVINSEEWDYKSFGSEEYITYYKEKSDTITFYKKFVIVRKKHYSDIFVNADDLPNFNINLEHCITNYRSGKNKILVHFKNVSKEIKQDKLLYFASELINDQLSSSEEIYLDIEYSDFKKEKNEVLDYLKSQLIYNHKIIKEIFI